MTQVRFNPAILLPLLALWGQPVAIAAVLDGAEQSFMTADAQNRCDPADPDCYSKLSMDFADFVVPQAPQMSALTDELQIDVNALVEQSSALSEAPVAAPAPETAGDSKAAETGQDSVVPNAVPDITGADIVVDTAEQQDDLTVVIDSVLADDAVRFTVSDMNNADAELSNADNALQSSQVQNYISSSQVAQVPEPSILVLLAIGMLGMRFAYKTKA